MQTTFLYFEFYAESAKSSLSSLLSKMSAAHSAEAALIITEAVNRFRNSVSSDDRGQIEGTGVKDVVNALVRIQQDLQERRENRNLRKLYPFVQGLERYSGAIDTLSNGLSPYLPWIWAPIKLMLRITSDYLSAFDKLIEAYSRIAETMPRLKNLGDTFKDNPTLLTKLALYYAEVLEFHRRAYKFVRRKSWKFFFNTTWASFDFRFDSILAGMAKYSEAIDKEAATIDIVEAKQWRARMISQVISKEKDRHNRSRQSVIAWLALDNVLQDDNREKLLRDCLQGSCDWVTKQEKVASWVKVDSTLPVVWLHGKPGAGKSVICASLIDLLEDSGVTTLSYFCRYYQNDTLSSILKTLVLKVVESSPDLLTMAYTEFVQKHHKPSIKILRTMLTGSGGKPGLLHGVPTCRIVVDGLDECDAKEQKYIVDDLIRLTSINSKDSNCKMLISSRDVPEISRAIRRKKRDVGVVSLSNEIDPVNDTIRSFAELRLRDLAEEKKSFQIGKDIVEEMVDIIISKAEGMFLWARLVLDSVSDVDSVMELHAAITSMPSELPQLYARILEALCPTASDSRMSKVMRILAWLVFAKRPLKRHELLHGVNITPETPVLDKWNLLDGSVIDKCKPLVEELADGNIALIHFTVEEYLRTNGSTQHLDPAVWEETIAFACVSVLRDSLCLLDPELLQIEQLQRILSGSCGLLSYSIDFWLDHVLVSASIRYLSEGSRLAQALGSLHLLHEWMCSDLKPKSSSNASLDTTIPVDSRLEALCHLSIYALGRSVLKFRAECEEKSANNGQEFEELLLEQDETLFSLLAQRFNDRVNQLLLSPPVSNDISNDQLDRFRDQYVRSSFRCRFAPCTRASLGFNSETARVSHEQLHVKRLFCNTPNCSRGRIGFRHQRDLKAHECTYHEQGSILVPSRVRKTFNIHTLPNEQRVMSYDISRSSKLSSPDEGIDSASISATQPGVAKYKPLISFDKVYEARAEWRYRLQSNEFALLRNKKRNPNLDVNLMHTFQHDSVVTCVDVSPDDHFLAITCKKTARVFDIRTRDEVNSFDIRHSFPVGVNHIEAIHFICQGHYLAGATDQGFLIVWGLQGSAEKVRMYRAHDRRIQALAVSADGYKIATCSNQDPTVKSWDLRDTTKERLCLSFPIGENVYGSVVGLTFSPDSLYIACACHDLSIQVRSSLTGNLLCKWNAHDLRISSVRFSSDGQTLISASHDMMVKIWDVGELKKLGNTVILLKRKLKLHTGYVNCSVMTSDGRWILSGSADQSISFWDAESSQPHLLLEGHYDSVMKLALGHSSHIFVTAGEDTRVRLWSYSG
ncbi:hypothetical protein F5Y08DRAFT_302008 [Xylaria arbuscula]|nr:hypothetical protein F5Y08DRAFT_302008 [Xylaria arbuscula]